MTHVLYDLKNGIDLVKHGPKFNVDSGYIENELETLYRAQEQLNKNRLHQEEMKKAAEAENKQTNKAPVNKNAKQNKKNTTQSIQNNKNPQISDNKLNFKNNRLNNSQTGQKTTQKPNTPTKSTSGKNSNYSITNVKFPAENIKQNINAISKIATNTIANVR